MDLSSPGPGPETSTVSESTPAGNVPHANGKSATSETPNGRMSDKSLEGVQNDHGGSIASLVRLRIECITDGEMKVSTCKA